MAEEFEGDGSKSVTYNQALFEQQRLHECLLRISRLSINPIAYNPEFQTHNYKIIFNDLCSVLSEISPKLKPDELKSTMNDKKVINDYINAFPIWNVKKHQTYGSKPTPYVDNKRWDTLSTALFDFRLKIEQLMEKHGFGNPDRDDPRKAVAS